MTKNINRKCRTCLKINTRTFPLTKYVTGCNPKRTYGHLLMEFGKFEFIKEQERNLPQQLCQLCCRQLRNTYAFIRQAQHCNKKLLALVKKQKQLECLQEQAIDLPSSSELDKLLNIKVENEGDMVCSTQSAESEDAKTGDVCIKNEENASSHVILKVELSTEATNEDSTAVSFDIKEMSGDEEDADEIEYENQSNDLSMECTSSENNISSSQLNDATESSEISNLKIMCPVCKKLLSRRDNLIKHMRIQHDIRDPGKLLEKAKSLANEPIFRCQYCPCKYTTKYVYLNHLENKHGIEKKERVKVENKIIKCRSCDYIAKTYAALHYHIKGVHGTDDDKFKCKFCPYARLKKFDLLSHIKNEHKDKIRSLRWEKENKIQDISNDALTKTVGENEAEQRKSTKLTTHNEHASDNDSSDDNVPLSHTRVKPKQVGSSFDIGMDDISSDEEFIRDLLNIKRRQTRTESTKHLPRRCDECGKIYKNLHALLSHQRHVHITEEQYSLCPHCGNKYKREKDLRSHIKNFHTAKPDTEKVKPPPKVREKRFMCTECSYVCKTMAVLRIHMNRHHTGEKPFKCDICDKGFILKFEMKTHRYIHTGERPFKCPTCSKGFRDHSHMVKHQRIHLSERPYKCLDCGKGFTKGYNLKVHKRTHLKDRKFDC